MKLESFFVEGKTCLKGEVRVHGAKNSVLPILAAAYLCKTQTVIHNCPDLTDVHHALEILKLLGCTISREDHTVCIDASGGCGIEIPDKLMCKMRSSVVFLGAVAAKNGKVKLTYPGGCALGARPIDLHLKALRLLGMTIDEECGKIVCNCEKGMNGTRIVLDFPSVGATENVIIAAQAAKGKTVLINAAREPEIQDLCSFLRKCGANISGDGGSVIEIEGVEQLYGCEYTIMPDRIEAATLLTAAAVDGEILLEKVDPDLLYPVIAVLKECGCVFYFYDDCIYMRGIDRPRRVNCVRTMPHPGFPTDAQAFIMALTTIADGTSVIIENIFENRFRHASELVRMGAKIKTEGRIAVVEGVKTLCGTSVTAMDLRGGSALVLAALWAEGVTQIKNIHFIDRGYEKLENTLSLLGARIARM